MKKTAIACISLMWLLTAAKIFSGDSQNSFSPDKIAGYFRQETYERGKTDANSPIPSSFLFQEGENGTKYAVYIPFFAAPSLRREYNIQCILVQKFLTENAKDDDYKRIIKSAWPDFTSADTKQAVKVVKDWMKKNPDMPLLLINTLRAELTGKSEGDVVAAKLIKRVPPVYPRDAIRQHSSGSVELEIVVDEDGRVEQLKFVKGNALFKDVAIDSVRQWRYSPILIGGKAVAVLSTVTVNFKLGDM